MSAALLKRSIAIVEESLPETKKAKIQNKFKHNQEINSKKVPNYRNNNNKLTVAEKYQNISRTNKIDKKQIVEDNVKKLLKRDEHAKAFNLDPETTEMMFERARTGRYVVSVDKKPVEETSIFTEEDFKNFEKEYFGT